MAKEKGLLLVTMEPPPNMEEEFNDWYDTEHLPERASIPGFATALRYVCVAGWPRYLALYDLDELAVLDAEGYTAVSGTKFSPWSKRVLGRVRGQCRMAADQVYPSQQLTRPLARMLFLRFSGLTLDHEESLVSSVRRAYEERQGVSQLRVFRESTASGPRFLVLVESTESLGQQNLTAGLGELAKHVDIVNEYAPYWTRGPLHGVYDKH